MLCRLPTDDGEATAVADDTTDRDAAGTVAFAYEMGDMKPVRRAGWWHVRCTPPYCLTRQPRSIAEPPNLRSRRAHREQLNIDRIIGSIQGESRLRKVS